MSKEPRKPSTAAKPDTAAKARREGPVTTNNTGRVRHDERGNAIWEWAVNTGAVATGTATLSPETSPHRLKKLDNPKLSLAPDAPSPVDVVKTNRLGTVKGYSPYDSGLLHKERKAGKKDLRRLSEWLKLKKQAENRKPDDE